MSDEQSARLKKYLEENVASISAVVPFDKKSDQLELLKEVESHRAQLTR